MMVLLHRRVTAVLGLMQLGLVSRVLWQLIALALTRGGKVLVGEAGHWRWILRYLRDSASTGVMVQGLLHIICEINYNLLSHIQGK